MSAEEAIVERFLAEIGTPAWTAGRDRSRPFAEAVAELAPAERPGFPTHRSRTAERIARDLAAWRLLD
jgi:hypothetical protein